MKFARWSSRPMRQLTEYYQITHQPKIHRLQAAGEFRTINGKKFLVDSIVRVRTTNRLLDFEMRFLSTTWVKHQVQSVYSPLTYQFYTYNWRINRLGIIFFLLEHEGLRFIFFWSFGPAPDCDLLSKKSQSKIDSKIATHRPSHRLTMKSLKSRCLIIEFIDGPATDHRYPFTPL